MIVILVIKFILDLVLFTTTCESAMEPFIEGGEYTNIESFPHSLYMYMLCPQPQVCGGSILTQTIILTAAHCFEHCLSKNDIIAYAGSESTNAMKVAAKVNHFRIHKHYNTKTLLNDIALGFLKVPLPLGNTIKRVFIARDFPGVKMARIAGWGVVDDNTLQQTEKLKVVLQIIQPKKTCSQEVVKLKAGMMCARNSITNHPSHGDSGCALVTTNGQQIGLVSYRIPERRDVVVYTNVSYFYDWIETQAVELSCSQNK